MQLPLTIEFPETACFDSFVAGPNALLVELLHKSARAEGEQQLYVWSEAGLGKTHLLQATCRAATAYQHSSCYLPLFELLAHSPGALEGLESLHLLALDQLHLFVGQEEWELALFNLINRCRDSGTRLIMAANANLSDLSWRLPDLASRLAWGPVFQIRSLSDADKINVLKGRAQRRGIELADDVAN